MIFEMCVAIDASVPMEFDSIRPIKSDSERAGGGVVYLSIIFICTFENFFPFRELKCEKSFFISSLSPSSSLNPASRLKLSD